jgi:hypothetical protein
MPDNRKRTAAAIIDSAKSPRLLYCESYGRREVRKRERVHLNGEGPARHRLSRVVEVCCFGGCPNNEVAAVPGVPQSAVMHDRHVPRAWLYERLQPSEARE